MTKSVVQGPQGNLAAVRTGSGQGLPLLFLHADPGRASQWDKVISLMAKSHDTVAFDFRGAGDSAPPSNGDYSYDGRAGDLGAVADAFGLKRFVIVAHSAGAAVALAYAALHNDRVAGIVMVDPATDSRALPADIRDGFVKDMAGPNSLDVFKAYVGSIAGPNAAVRDQVIADAKMLTPAARAGVAKASATWNPDATLKAYKGPIFVLATPATDTAGALYRLRPDIPHQIVQTEGHWLQLNHPDVVEKAIKKFLMSTTADAMAQ